MNIALLLSNFHPNVYCWIEYIDLRVRNVYFDMGNTEAFPFAVQPDRLSYSFVQSIYPVGWSAQPNLRRVHADTHDFIAFRQLAFKLDLHVHRHLNDWLQPNGNRSRKKPLNLDVFLQFHFHAIKGQLHHPLSSLLIA